MSHIPICLSSREAGPNFNMENFHCRSGGESQIPHIVPKRVAALRAEVEHNKANIQTKARRRLRDFKPSPLSLPPLRKRSSNMRTTIYHRPPEFLTSYPVLPPISRRKSPTEKSDYKNGNFTANNNRFATTYGQVNCPPSTLQHTNRNLTLYKKFALSPNISSDSSCFRKHVSTFNRGSFTNHFIGNTAKIPHNEIPLRLKSRNEQPNTERQIHYNCQNTHSSSDHNRPIEQKYYPNVEPPLICNSSQYKNIDEKSCKNVNPTLCKYANVQPLGTSNDGEENGKIVENTTKSDVEQNRYLNFEPSANPNKVQHTNGIQQLAGSHSQEFNQKSSANHSKAQSISKKTGFSEQPCYHNDNEAAQCISRKDEISNTGILGKYMYGNIQPSQLDKAVKYIYKVNVVSQQDSSVPYSCETSEEPKTEDVVHYDNDDMGLCKRFGSQHCKSENAAPSLEINSQQRNDEQVDNGSKEPCSNLASEPCRIDDVHCQKFLTDSVDKCKEDSKLG